MPLSVLALSLFRCELCRRAEELDHIPEYLGPIVFAKYVPKYSFRWVSVFTIEIL